MSHFCDVLAMFVENGLEKAVFVLITVVGLEVVKSALFCSDGPVIVISVVCGDGLVMFELLLFNCCYLVGEWSCEEYYFFAPDLTVCHDQVVSRGLSVGCCMAQLVQLVSKLLHGHNWNRVLWKCVLLLWSPGQVSFFANSC